LIENRGAVRLLTMNRPDKRNALNMALTELLIDALRAAQADGNVRSIVLTIREQPYIEAATAIGTSVPRIMLRHLLPNALPPLIVQATYICASAVLIEAALSFLGAGTPPEIPSWGNIMAEARPYFQLKPSMVLLPGLFLAATVLAINLVGDGLRDMLDPRLARRM